MPMATLPNRHIADSTPNQNTNKEVTHGNLFICRWPESNRHEGRTSPDFESGTSTNFITSAYPYPIKNIFKLQIKFLLF